MDQTAIPVPTKGGRVLQVAAYGPRDGSPVVLMHGTPGSRLFPPLDPNLLDRVNVRLISYDRPGYGGSSRLPDRRVIDAAGDVAQIADAFGLTHFGVVGFSGGGPHALACAAVLAGRVARCATIGSVAPFDAADLDWWAGMSESNVEEFTTAQAGETSLAAELDPIAKALTDDAFAVLASWRSEMPPEDAAAVGRPDIDQLLATMLAEGLRPGAAGWVDDDLAFLQPWDVELPDVEIPVAVWQGTQDTFVPPAHGAWLARTIPTAEGHIVVGSGHYGLLDSMEEILRWLVS